MTELFPVEMFPAASVQTPRTKLVLSKKQHAIIAWLSVNKTLTLTLAQAVELIGGNLYTNAAKHVGVTLANMVKRGLIVREKPGVFRLL